MNRIKIILISSTLPRDTSAGEVVLYRHLTQFPGLSLSIASDQEFKLQSTELIKLKNNNILNRLVRTRYHKWFHDIIQCLRPFFNYRQLRKYLTNNKIDLILTVAEGIHWIAAQKISKEFNIPLVTIFHDWWPDMALTHTWTKKILDKKITSLYSQSQLVFCVSEELKKNLGEHSNVKILYPIPAKNLDKQNISQTETEGKSSFKLIYAGRLSLFYSLPLQELSRTFLFQYADQDSKLKLKLFGSLPNWSTLLLDQLKDKNIYGGFISRELLTTELQNADALLVIIPFNTKSRRWAETSFPSKLIEYCKFGKPIIIWGPNYSNAVKWAVQHQSALIVTSPSVHDLLTAMNKLSIQKEEQIRLGNRALALATGMFNAESIQQIFVDSIYDIVNKKNNQTALIDN